MNKRKLNAIMQLYGESQQDLAGYLQMSLSRLNAKINEYRGAQFRQNEIAAIQEHYKLTAEEVNEIFFASIVSQKDTVTPTIWPADSQSDDGERWAQVFNP